MRYNRWIQSGSKRDLERICNNHPETADLIRALAAWIIDQLAVNPNEKGELGDSPNAKTQHRRWIVGPLSAIFTVMPADDRTVSIDGFLPIH